MEFIQKHSDYYTASDAPELVHMGTAHYVSILGDGSPGTNVFYEKKTAIKDFVTALQLHVTGTDQKFNNSVIEIFYWYDEKEGYVEIGNFYTTLSLDLLNYRIAIRIPEGITEQQIKTIAEKHRNISFSKDFEKNSYSAGDCVQIMHSGPFADELKTLPLLQKFATDNGWVNTGLHHEIHLTPFEKGQNQQHLKTILRDAVKQQH